MPSKKRSLDEEQPPKSKKIRVNNEEAPAVSNLFSTEIDFPRGGGTSLTPLEYRNVRAEAIREADAEVVFANSEEKKGKKRKHGMDIDHAKGARSKSPRKDKKDDPSKKKNDNIRVEHLNYKRIVEGMKIFGKIIAIQPLALLVSLPCQLVGHIPITNISSQLTHQLEKLDEEEDVVMAEDEEDEDVEPNRPLELFEIFKVGQYVRTVVTAVRFAGASAEAIVGSRRRLDETERASQRIELSLVPEQVNSGVSKDDLVPGFVLPAAVQSVEDHGYILDLGVPEMTGFLSFKDSEKAELPKLRVGYHLGVCVSTVGENKRTCNVTVEFDKIRSSAMTTLTSVTSVLPGTLVQALITAVIGNGLNVQILGYLNGTIDISHITPKDFKNLKLGQKIKARVLWDITSHEPRQLALSLLPHIINLHDARMDGEHLIQEAFPIGTTLDSVKVVKVESEHGLTMEVQENVPGLVYIRHVSDEHVPSLSPSIGQWKIGTVHRARVTGFHALDGILQLSMQQSVLEQKFLQVQDVTVGEVLKTIIKKLTPAGLFVLLFGNIDGVIWPNHFADIMLKHPQKRFKEGATIKCRVLVVNPDKKRIVLTAKRTLVDSELPIITKFEDAVVGTVTHATVYRITPKGLLIEFYNNIHAFVPSKEASETSLANLEEAFSIGKPVKVRIIYANPETNHITASIRQASKEIPKPPDVQLVQIGDTVKGQIQAVHKEHAVITLDDSRITALLSLKNLANSRGITETQLRVDVAVGDEIDDLIVVSQNPEKGIVIVSKRPKDRPKGVLPENEGVTLKTVQRDQILSARVVDYKHGGTHLHIAPGLNGVICPTDIADDYDTENLIPAIGTTIKGIVLDVNKHKKQVTLSTRPSRLSPHEQVTPKDPEISSLDDLKVGLHIRGFIKNITDHGLYVTVGRGLDARVKIKELFDEYVKEWKPRFSLDQLVQGRIARVDKEARQIEMTFRSTPIELELEDLHKGQKVDGVIKAKEKYGLFIQIKDAKVSGLCHKSEISDNSAANIEQVLQGFVVGDPVKAIILDIDMEKRRISFGLKPSYFSREDLEVTETVANGAGKKDVPLEIILDEDDKSDDSDEELDDGQPIITADVETSVQPNAIPILKTTGFQWSGAVGTIEDDESGSSDISEEDEGREDKKTKKKKKKAIEYDTTGDMHTRRPESVDDFERVLLGSPNSSFLWVQYMSLQLQLSEIDKAREIGKRALQTINFREEGEKLNVWIALLNLENQFGTDDTLDRVFKDAARANDSKTIHLRLAAIFDESGRHERAIEQYQKTCKKFSRSSKVWVLFAEYYFKRRDFDAARQLLPRSLQSLEKRKHIKTISKFALLEHKHGEPERGKTIFEGIVDSHPKRWDLWSVYIDMEALQNNIQSIRNLFDRVLSLKMTSFKAKAFFKKWLELEKRIGDVDGESNVKVKAIEWTQKSSAGAP